MTMTKIEKRQVLITRLREAIEDSLDFSIADAHINADAALLAYIDDKEITDLFEQVEKWYD